MLKLITTAAVLMALVVPATIVRADCDQEMVANEIAAAEAEAKLAAARVRLYELRAMAREADMNARRAEYELRDAEYEAERARERY